MTLVPRNRLLFWAAAVMLPAGLLVAVEPQVGVFCALATGALVLVAIADALGAGKVLSGIQLELPPVTRMSRDRPSALAIRIHNAFERERSLRLGLGLPPEMGATAEEVFVSLPAGAEWSQVEWPCVPRQRGKYRVETAYAEGCSRLGLWAVRRALPMAGEIRVYPNLLQDRRSLAALFLHRGMFGLHAQRQVGKGRDFEKLREYSPGDSFDEIHWKATARRGKPVTKVFQIERTQEVYVIIDASRLSARETPPAGASQTRGVAGETGSELEPGHTVLERFLTGALALGLAAEQQGDLFGLLSFTNRVESFVRARNGQAHFNACRDALYVLQPQGVSPDFNEVCSFIRMRLRRRALLVFLTSLDDPALADSFVASIELIRRQHLVFVSMLRPPGAQPMFSGGPVAGTDDLYRHLGGHLQWRRLRELGKVLQRRGVKLSLPDQEGLTVQLVAQYLNVKQRQLI